MKAVYFKHMGDDKFICDMARISFDMARVDLGKKVSEYSKERNDKLIKYLAKHDHWTPFGHPQITMMEEVPIFVARQR